MVYGYCRISRREQNIERQIRNIRAAYPEAVVIQEAYTGTKIEGREKLEKLLKRLRAGDVLVFDSVSRMSRNAQEGVELYERLYNAGIELVFLREPHINTATYKSALAKAVPMTGTKADCIIRGINEFLIELAKEQITKAFEQAEKEVSDLHQRTREGIMTARMNGKQIGGKKGAVLNVKKKPAALAAIRKYSKDFDGTLNDAQVMKLAGVSRNTFYKYKRELMTGTN